MSTWLKTTLLRFFLAGLALFYFGRPAASRLAGTGKVPAEYADAIQTDWYTLGELDVETGSRGPRLDAIADQVVRLPGYVVPFDDGFEEATEFLFVPYFGACIHVPPPPENQMVYVKMRDRQKLKVNIWGWDPIWIVGRLSVKPVDSPFGAVGFAMEGFAALDYSFTATVSGTDLIVGSRGSATNLLLSAIFGLGSPGRNIAYATYERLATHEAVDWAVPFALGDSHRGFRVVGTTNELFEVYRYRHGRRLEWSAGKSFVAVEGAVIGAAVADELGYRLGDRLVVAHGLGQSLYHHDDNPFVVAGILAATQTPIDRSVFISLAALAAIHAPASHEIGADSGAPGPGKTENDEAHAPKHGETHEHDHDHDHESDGLAAQERAARDSASAATQPAISAVLLGLRSRPDALRLQRELENGSGEPLTAAMPAVALTELWRFMIQAERGLRMISLLVLAVGLLGLLVMLFAALEGRRREMAILWALGLGIWQIGFLLVFEAALLVLSGLLIGVASAYASLIILQPWIEQRFGIFLAPAEPTTQQLWGYALVLVVAVALGLLPARNAVRRALADGLSGP